MKKTTILAYLMLFFLSIQAGHAYSQNQNSDSPNANNINNSLNKFVGTWQWTNVTDTLKIVLKKENALMPMLDNVHLDIIIGFYLYKKGDTVIENSINYSNTKFSDEYYTIMGTNNNQNDTLEARIKEKFSNNTLKRSFLSLIIDSNHKRLEWKLGPMERKMVFTKKVGTHSQSKFTLPNKSLPKKLTLFKVE
ncbi:MULTISPECIES: DUF6705 family protein [Chitinophagaceae]